MRKKYLYLYIASAAILAGSCVKTDNGLPDNSIVFSPVASKATRAIISGASYPTTESFVVSAFYNGSYSYFEDLAVSYSSAQSKWTGETDQYWPLNGSLTFHAYSPESAVGVSIDASNGISASNYTIQTTAQMTTDLCYATATVADCSNHPDAVPLTFSHALSQVVFRVKAADYYTTVNNTVTISLTSLSLGGILSVGDFADESWDNLSSARTYTLSNATTALTYDGENNPQATEVCSYLFLPQELSEDASINVGYSVNQSALGSLSNPPVAIKLKNTITEWQPGKKYIYTLNIGMNNLITFSASAVGWLEENYEIIVEEY